VGKTNGYNLTAVLEALDRLGMQPSTNERYECLVDTANQQSASGLYYNGFHSIVTPQNIFECQPDPSLDEKGFNKYIAQMKKDVAISMLNSVFDAPQFIDSGLLFNVIGQSSSEKVVKSGTQFRFITVQPSNSNDFGQTLNSVLLYFDGNTPFNLYLFHSLTDGTDVVNNNTVDVTYLKKWNVTPKAKKVKRVSLDYDINYNNDVVAGGVYFIGYFESEIGDMHALKLPSYRNMYKTFYATCGSSKAEDGPDFNRFVFATSDDMCGLNLEISSYYDRTKTIVNNAHLFDNLQGLMFAAKVIEMICSTTRSNATQRITKEIANSLMLQLKGYKDGEAFIPGIEHKISAEVKRIRKSFTTGHKQSNVDIC